MFHVVTGGSGSGKSAFAEQCILDCQGSKRIYIATMYPFDEESYRRIARHRAMRAEKKFTTIERYTDGLIFTIQMQEAVKILSAAKAPKKDGKGNAYVDIIGHHMPLLDAMRTASRKAFAAAFCS